MILIEQCEKRPGLLVGARVYRMVMNDEGVYLMELGKGMGQRVDSGVISNMIIDKIQANREKQYAEKEKELSETDLNAIVDNKKNFRFRKGEVKSVKFTGRNTLPCLQIKSAVLNITLYFQTADGTKVEQVYEYLK